MCSSNFCFSTRHVICNICEPPNNLDVVFTKLGQLCTQLSLSTIWPAGAPVANGGVITIANSLKVDLATFKANMNSYKSKVSKTK